MDVETSTELLRRHLKKPAKNPRKKREHVGMWTCKTCQKKFGDKYLLCAHKKIHDKTRSFRCQYCDFESTTRKYTRRHEFTQHENIGSFRCDMCPKVYKRKAGLKAHMRTHTGEKPFKCEICSKSFNSSYTLSGHKFIHTGEKPFACAFCDYACRDSSTLRKHEETHTGVKKMYFCKVCDKICKKKAQLKSHVAEMHLRIDVKVHACAVCPRRFKLKSALKVHVRSVHERSTKCECEICGLVISNKYNMKAHLSTHFTVKPYSCQFTGCGKAFKRKGDLAKHKRIHYEHLQFVCDICSKHFARKGRLRLHIEKHARERRDFECDQCGASYRTEKSLSLHSRRKHRRMPKYECDLCGLIVTNKMAMAKHMTLDHASRYDTQCNICMKTFRKKKYLKKHYLDAHKIGDKMNKSKNSNPIEDVSDEVPGLETTVIKEEVIDIEEHDLMSLLTNTGKNVDAPEDKREHEKNNIFSEKNVTTENFKRIQDVPNSVYEDFYTSRYDFVAKKQTDDMTVDSKKQAEAERSLKKLLIEARQKMALKLLERARRAYNRRINNYYKSTLKGNEKILLRNNFTKSLECDDFQANYETVSSENNISPESNKSIIQINESTIHKVNNNDLYRETNFTDDFTNNLIQTKAANNKRLDKSGETKGYFNKNEKIPIGREVSQETVNSKKDNSANEIVDVNASNITENGGILDKGKDNRSIDASTVVSERKNKVKHIIKLKAHQCYVCFQIYGTKEALNRHCTKHFDVCSEDTLKKCPFCDFVAIKHISKHLKEIHNKQVKYRYGKLKVSREKLNQSKYYFEIDDDDVNKIQIIPSVKLLNFNEKRLMEKKMRNAKEKMLKKPKLVKNGNEWVVMEERLEFKLKEHLVPKIEEGDLAKIKFKIKEDYLEVMQILGHVAKKKGVLMLYPCEHCQKICQTFNALKLHFRKHDLNPKPFRPKVYKHKTICNNNKKKLKRKKVNIIEDNINKVKTNTNNKSVETMNNNRYEDPKPIKNKHRCDEKIKQFYLENVKGGDIEFWQFLKIYNKMTKNGVDNFGELET